MPCPINLNSFERHLQEAEEAAAAKAAKLEAHAAAHAAQAAAAAAAAEAENNMQNMAKSPSDFSCHSYELFVGQEKGNDDNNKEKMSIRSEGLESVSEMHQRQPSAPSAIASGTIASANKVRKVSAVSRRQYRNKHVILPSGPPLPLFLRTKTHSTITPAHSIYPNIGALNANGKRSSLKRGKVPSSPIS